MRPVRWKITSRSCRALCSTHVKLAIEQARVERRQVERRQAVDARDLLAGADLDQAQLRVVRLLAHELRVDGGDRRCARAPRRAARAPRRCRSSRFPALPSPSILVPGALTLSSRLRESGNVLSAAPDSRLRRHHAASARARAACRRRRSCSWSLLAAVVAPTSRSSGWTGGRHACGCRRRAGHRARRLVRLGVAAHVQSAAAVSPDDDGAARRRHALDAR